MKCKKCQKLISGYLDGELQKSELEAFEAHVRDCGKCAGLLRESLQIDKAFAAAPRYQAPAYFAARVRAAVEEDAARASWFDFFLGKHAYLKAAEIALAIIVVFIGAVSGNLATSGGVQSGPAEIRSSYSLDVFDPEPPGSIAGAYISILGGNHE